MALVMILACYGALEIVGVIITARCTLVQSAVLPSHVVCLSVCLYINVG